MFIKLGLTNGLWMLLTQMKTPFAIHIRYELEHLKRRNIYNNVLQLPYTANFFSHVGLTF